MNVTPYLKSKFIRINGQVKLIKEPTAFCNFKASLIRGTKNLYKKKGLTPPIMTMDMSYELLTKLNVEA